VTQPKCGREICSKGLKREETGGRLEMSFGKPGYT